ncbi:hypothetical protein AAFF_G00169430 [Aldrovandia affinis]|uniref:HCLS1-associated protein X-1 n=1 Tax=Aldrovandia affinis TaxID=143900 RepID=A0AAD7W7Q8_9TELE|nr:hypothetical protein AAFF_G00169430 [Aldrovandia affinis]
MNVFDLFRGFFGVPGGQYHGDGRYPGRDAFFDAMTHDDEDDDEDDDFRDYEGEQRHRDPFDEALRFGFSFGPSGLHTQESQLFGQVFREMEEIFSRLGPFGQQPGFGRIGVPGIEAPPTQDGAEWGRGGASAQSLRDFMLKSPDSPPRGPPGAPPSGSSVPRWSPFSKFNDILRGGLKRGGEEDAVREDRDLDSRVTVTKVVKPDGTVEERRTVRDGQGNEKTTVTHSGPGDGRGPRDLRGPSAPSLFFPYADQRDEGSIFAKYFGGFKS